MHSTVLPNINHNGRCLYLVISQILKEGVALIRVIKFDAADNTAAFDAHGDGRLTSIEDLMSESEILGPLDGRHEVLVIAMKECVVSTKKEIHFEPEK